ncbi:MAG: homoserine dehydrogenase [Anaerolineae bacterium]|nr:homoserine dehydrogenase [Anaerolineae bacterium]
MHLNVALLGFGNVGRALAGLLVEKAPVLEAQFGLTYTVTGIATRSRGQVIDSKGVDVREALALVAKGEALAALPGGAPSRPDAGVEFIRACPADLVFESIWLDPRTGQPATDYARAALSAGRHLVTANKGPVAFAYRELSALARTKDVGFFFESTVMDGAPVLGIAREGLPGVHVKRIRGVLNSTTNGILCRIEEGLSYEAALAEMQAAGLAETDPSADVDGWDATVKIVVLANVVMGADLRPQDVDREGIRHLKPEIVRGAAQAGDHFKLLCEAWREDGEVKASVRPARLPGTDPAAQVRGATSIVSYYTDVLPNLTIIEHDPSPRTTGYGMLADMVNLARGRHHGPAILARS